MFKVFKVVIAISILGFCNCIKVKQESNIIGISTDTENAILGKKKHTLTWREYKGYGDKEKAIYILDGYELGQGAAGYSTLKLIIIKMPEGSSVYIEPYYGDPGGDVRMEYPFDTFELYKYTEKYDVFLGIPCAA